MDLATGCYKISPNQEPSVLNNSNLRRPSSQFTKYKYSPPAIHTERSEFHTKSLGNQKKYFNVQQQPLILHSNYVTDHFPFPLEVSVSSEGRVEDRHLTALFLNTLADPRAALFTFNTSQRILSEHITSNGNSKIPTDRVCPRGKPGAMPTVMVTPRFPV